jgi:hypothetical protein
MSSSYELEFEDRGDYLYARLTGRDSVDAGLHYWQAIADRAVELGHKKILVHENMLGRLTKAQMFDLVTRLVQPEYLGIRIAFFDENLDDSTLNALGQLVAVNRGATVEIFPSLQAAQHWIKQAG